MTAQIIQLFKKEDPEPGQDETVPVSEIVETLETEVRCIKACESADDALLHLMAIGEYVDQFFA